MLRPLMAVLLLTGFTALAQADGGVFSFPLGSSSAPFGYVAYFPPGYPVAGEQYPLVVSLHGLGEIGNGTTQLQSVLVAGPIHQLQAVSADRTYFQQQRAILVQPQAPDQWMFNPQLPNMTVFFQYLTTAYPIDRSRVYLTGLSSGGGGVYTFVGDGRAHGLLAAIVPICGNNEAYASFLPHFRDLPMWAFQNWGDSTNPRHRAIDFTTGAARQRTGSTTIDVMSNYPNTAGDPNQAAATMMTAVLGSNSFTWVNGHGLSSAGDLRLTLGTSNSHDAWSDAYGDHGMWDWLFSHRLDGGYLLFDGGVAPADAGLRADAGVDAGVRIDAGTRFDGGADSGVRIDAGAVDAGTRVDAGSLPDAGSVFDDAGLVLMDAGTSPIDAGAAVDAGETPDAGSVTVTDAGTSAVDAGGEGSMPPVGCGCHTGTGSALWLALGLVAMRRRRH